MKFFEEFSGAFGSRKKLADNEECPLVADQLQRAGDWAAIDFASSHSGGFLAFAAKLITISAYLCDRSPAEIKFLNSLGLCTTML